MRTTAKADSRTTPSTTGRSLLVTACRVSDPMPGRAKTVSITTVPPSSVPVSQPANVSKGVAACRKAWRSLTAL